MEHELMDRDLLHPFYFEEYNSLCGAQVHCFFAILLLSPCPRQGERKHMDMSNGWVPNLRLSDHLPYSLTSPIYGPRMWGKKSAVCNLTRLFCYSHCSSAAMLTKASSPAQDQGHPRHFQDQKPGPCFHSSNAYSLLSHTKRPEHRQQDLPVTAERMGHHQCIL